ncbi:uncharacterized protein H6S33_006118 [Morchella sextelata]|uniref:uncharacterized protein n=1 Tax=Morchella sextelata TaxID=1174677 RepID=UPI001D042872|nr:uncharacterized protein H6S33_006118 [Morchella sextelata]KAH0614232.1 hypothetical protein H6S33_006118 [Morchella sextelata]
MPPPAPLPPLKVHQTVELLLTEPESRTYKRRHIICLIDKINSSHTRFQLLSEWGVIDEWFPRDRVVAAPEKFFNPAKRAAYILLDLEKALMQDGGYGFRKASLVCLLDEMPVEVLSVLQGGTDL